MRKKKKKKEENKDVFSDKMKLSVAIVKEIGIGGFVIVTLLTIFIVYGSSEQKQNFIDMYLLQNSYETNKFPCIITITILVILLIINAYFCHRQNKLKQVEINRVSKERTQYQEILLGKLHTSKK